MNLNLLSEGASSSNLQVTGIIVASLMSALTTIIVAFFTYRTTINQQQIDAKLKAGNEKLDVIHVLTNSRLTMALRAVIVLKRKSGEPLTEEELAVERGDNEQLAASVKREAEEK